VLAKNTASNNLVFMRKIPCIEGDWLTSAKDFESLARSIFQIDDPGHPPATTKMKTIVRSTLSAVFLILLASSSPRATAQALKVGDAAPNFSLTGSDGKTYKLSSFKGKQAVVVAWFPKAFTGGCTAECKSMRETGPGIRAYDVAYFTASVDPAETNKKFAESLQLDYPILSDPTFATAKAYGVFNDDRKFANRWTFYVGKDGKILFIDTAVKTGSHGSDIAGKLKELGVTQKK